MANKPRLIAGVGYVKPTASVTAQTPRASVEYTREGVVGKTYIIPVFDVSWINIVYAAELDPIGRNPLIFDVFVVVDDARKLFGKGASEQLQTTSDIDTIEFGKGLTEPKTAVEQHTFDLQKSRQDVARTDDSAFSKFVLAPREDFVSTSDSASPRAEKNLNEYQSAVDELQPFVLGKSVEEDVPTSEITTYDFAKELADAADAGDEMNAAVTSDDGQTSSFFKVSAELADVEEADVIEFGKSAEDDAFTSETQLVDIEKTADDVFATSEEVTSLIEKPLFDVVDAGDELNNLFQTDDGQILLTYKRLTDSFVQSDEQVTETGKARDDSFAAVDELQPFELGKLIEDVPLTSDLPTFATVKPLEDLADVEEQHAVGFNRPLTDRLNFPAEGPAQYDTYAISYFLEDYCREGAPALFVEKLTVDFAVVSEVVSNVLAKPFADSIGTDDQAGKSIGKGAEEYLGVSDTEDFEFNKSANDLATTSEAKSFDVSKELSDTVDATDDFYGLMNVDDDQVLSFATNRVEHATTTEDVTQFVGKRLDDVADTADQPDFDVAKPAADSFSVGDVESTSIQKPRSDAFATSDAATNLAGKSLSDSGTTSEHQVFATNKLLADGFASADALTEFVEKVLADVADLSDSHITSFSKTLSDPANTSDSTRTYAISKVLSDYLDATDDFNGVTTTEDDQTMQFSTSRAEVATVSDLSNRVAGKGLTEMVDTGDSGSLRMTDYCDVNYFAESYVGTSLNF